ncbi:hypothetical protein [Butyricicoccus sp.]|uniref:hypothetical protein n=1 Tax=Butyricicoccus sp. TaxID=2049021 RepID=UPI003F15B15B
MSKTEKFFRAMAWLCLGVIIGFFVSPIKQGVDIQICSNNTDTVFGDDNDDDDDDKDDGSDDDEPEMVTLEDF